VKDFILFMIVLGIFGFFAGFMWLAQLKLGLWILGVD